MEKLEEKQQATNNFELFVINYLKEKEGENQACFSLILKQNSVFNALEIAKDRAEIRQEFPEVAKYCNSAEFLNFIKWQIELEYIKNVADIHNFMVDYAWSQVIKRFIQEV